MHNLRYLLNSSPGRLFVSIALTMTSDSPQLTKWNYAHMHTRRHSSLKRPTVTKRSLFPPRVRVPFVNEWNIDLCDVHDINPNESARTHTHTHTHTRQDNATHRKSLPSNTNQTRQCDDKISLHLPLYDVKWYALGIPSYCTLMLKIYYKNIYVLQSFTDVLLPSLIVL